MERGPQVDWMRQATYIYDPLMCWDLAVANVWFEGICRMDRIDISLLGDVVEGKGLKEFITLQEEFSMPKTQFFKYMQLRHALNLYQQ